MTDLLIGSVVAGYRLERPIGRGGMGIVYEAVELDLGRRVAVKVIAPEFANDQGFRRRFVVESRVAASIEHPAVLPIYRAAEAEGVLFLAMRLVAGEDLATIVRRHGPLAPDRAARIVAQVAGALDAAHGHRLVHRDVKPANVLVDADDRAYLTDFGLAKDLDDAAGHTRTGVVVGTLDYLAPEQIRMGAIGPWTDIYALGCVLFFVLTGRVVFPLDSAERKLWAHVTEPPPRPSTLRAGLPAKLDQVVQRALAKAPKDRWSTPTALAAAALAAIEVPRERHARPVTRYAKADGVNVAYQVIGDGPRDVVFVPGWVSHIEHYWQSPACARFLRRLAAASRLIIFDKRGTGLSDRSERLPSIDERMDDITAVMAAAGSERAALVGYSEGGAIASLFAATFPEATSALVLYAANAKCTQTADYPWGYTPEQAESMFTAYIEQFWGSGEGVALLNPSVADDPDVKQWVGEMERLGASPGAALALWRTDTEMDVRAVLPAVQAPTLVIHRVDDQFVDVAHGRFLADHIPGARYLELDGNDHMPWFGDAETLLDEIERFLDGSAPRGAIDRILATIMVTDFANASGQHVAHQQQLVDERVTDHGGRADRTQSSAPLASFDGPARALRCATAIAEDVRRSGRRVRIGLHTGECGVRGETLTGIAVDIAAQIAALAEPGQILATRTVRDLVVGSGIRFIDRGDHRLAGIPDRWQLFEVEPQGPNTSTLAAAV